MKENNNGNDTNVGSKGNSIEEDIKIALDKFSDNKDSNSAVLIVEQFILGNYVLVGGRKDIVKNSLRYILSDYKRVLKENEEKTTILLAGAEKVKKLEKENKKLKEDRNNNNEMVALARNEVLGYMQGYEDGKKLKRSAVACVVENQQYYIIKKEIEHYKEYIEKLQKENEELKNKLLDTLEGQKVIKEETPQYIKENFIPIEKVKDKIEEILNNKEYRIVFEGNAEFPDDATIINAQKYIKLEKMQELIEESEEK